jgi:opacity protein-like surface antigen
MQGEWMIGKFASTLGLLSLTILLVPRGFAQATPAGQPPAPTSQPPATTTQQAAPPNAPSTGQESADEISTSRPKKARNYKKWEYNVGAGLNLDSGHTKTFVRGGGIVGAAGVARNANKFLGLRGDFIFANLPLRQSSLSLAQAGSASSYFLAVTLDPVINIPVTKLWGGYILFGPGFFRRWGNLDSDTAIPGSSCNPFFQWWDACPNVSIPLNGSFTSASQNEFGYNVGAGITRKMPSGVEIYAEYRLTHASANGTTTDVRPITLGVRW